MFLHHPLHGLRVSYISVLKTGLNVVLACNLPKNNPMLEVRYPYLLYQCLCFKYFFSLLLNAIADFFISQNHNCFCSSFVLCLTWLLGVQASAEKKLLQKLISLGYTKPQIWRNIFIKRTFAPWLPSYVLVFGRNIQCCVSGIFLFAEIFIHIEQFFNEYLETNDVLWHIKYI